MIRRHRGPPSFPSPRSSGLLKLGFFRERLDPWKMSMPSKGSGAFEPATRVPLQGEIGTNVVVPSPAARNWQLLAFWSVRSEEHTSELQSRSDLVCRLLLEKK